MSTPQFNASPRAILIQPTHRSVATPGKPVINYYVCVIDLPNSMLSSAKTPIFSSGSPSGNDSSQLHFVLENVLFSGYPNSNEGFTDFSTWLIPIYTKQNNANGNPHTPFTSVIVSDKSDPPIIRVGTFATTIPVKKMEIPKGETLTAEVFTNLEARPFVIKNGSNAPNGKNYFIGCMALAPSNFNYGNSFKTMEQKSAAEPHTLLCNLDRVASPAVTASTVAAIGILQVTQNEYTLIEVTDISSSGTSQTLDYVTPDATI